MAVKTPIYMDCHATTPLDGRVLEEMLPYLREHFGNAIRQYSRYLVYRRKNDEREQQQLKQ